MQVSVSCLKEREDICVVYDNFDYQEQVHHQIIGSNSVLHHFTTGMVFCGRDIPSGGLKQDMLHNDVRLKRADIMNAQGNLHDHVQDQISNFSYLMLFVPHFRKRYTTSILTLVASVSI